MAIPNLIALAFLSPVVIKLTKETTKEELEKIVKEIQLETDKKIEDSRIKIVG